MKVVVKEVENEGLSAFLGKKVTLFCNSYFYTGVLSGVNSTCVKLDNAAIVYETGPLNDKIWKDVQSLPGVWYVQVSAIESFGELK
jgi:hypothetical protein